MLPISSTQRSLRQAGVDTLNRRLRSGASDEMPARLVTVLRDDDRLGVTHEAEEAHES